MYDTYREGKSSKSGHDGIGLQNVKGDIGKISGEMNICAEDGIFTVSLMFGAGQGQAGKRSGGKRSRNKKVRVRRTQNREMAEDEHKEKIPNIMATHFVLPQWFCADVRSRRAAGFRRDLKKKSTGKSGVCCGMV